MIKLDLEYDDNRGYPIAEIVLSADESHLIPLSGDRAYVNGKGFTVTRRDFSFEPGNITVSLIGNRD